VTLAEAEALVAEVDSDGDGRLGFNEFVYLITRGGGGWRAFREGCRRRQKPNPPLIPRVVVASRGGGEEEKESNYLVNIIDCVALLGTMLLDAPRWPAGPTAGKHIPIVIEHHVVRN